MIAPSKCYQGPGGPESGKRGAGERERETRFHPVHPNDKSQGAARANAAQAGEPTSPQSQPPRLQNGTDASQRSCKA